MTNNPDNPTPLYAVAPPAPPLPQQQGPAPYVQTTPRVDGLAIASLVLGILWMYWIGSILAMIFGAVALRRINASNGWRTGKGMAIAGLVLGLVGAGTLLAVLLVFMAAGASS